MVAQGLTKRCSRRLPAARPAFVMIKTVQEIVSLAPGSRG
jgi:hypothetical protein